MTRHDWAHLSDAQPLAMRAREPNINEVMGLVFAAGVVVGAVILFVVLTMLAAEPVATAVLGG